ncbi:MAG TPA: nucleotide exchange factor GrpE [Burkholderiaceae bacterium]|nr:nucleotide exchange factor GrpE [Burkholderiaceae bacterium]
MIDEQGSGAGAGPRNPQQDPAAAAASTLDTGANTPPPGDDSAAAGRIAELEARCEELNDRYLRAVAETENVRRRGQEEVTKANKYGIESFAESLLPVRDSLELALRSDAPSVENIREGVETTLRLLATVFERNKLIEIDPAGQKFDPNLHQAISTVPGDSADPPAAPNHVVTVLQKGYLINDRVLRPALVIVAQG